MEGGIGNIRLAGGTISLHIIFVSNNEISIVLSEAG
jgi:hypothetical protein